MPPETPDLSAPRRTSALGALLGVFAVEQLRPLLPVVVVAASSGNFVVVLAVGLVAGVGFNVATWWRRTWWFDDGVLHLDEGVIVRNQRRIPVERIQHVELDQRLRHQLFGLSIVRVETAGGSGAELELDAITTAQAHALRAGVVAAARRAGAADEPVSVTAEILVRLPPGRLLIAGVTGPEVLAVLAALAVGADIMTDLGLGVDDVGRVEVTALVMVALVIIAVPIWILAAGLIGVVRRWDLTATIRGDDLRVTYGLLRRSEFTVDLGRVQDVRISHRFLLRPFARADLRVRTAASGTSDRSRVDIPLLDRAEIDHVLDRVLPAALPLPPMRAAPPAARRRSWIRGGVAGTVVGASAGTAIGAASSSGPLLTAALVAVVGLGGGLGWGEAAYRGLGAATTNGGSMVHSRAGAFTRDHAIVPAERLQSVAVESTWFQRQRGLATVRLDLAGARVEVIDRGQRDASMLASRALD